MTEARAGAEQNPIKVEAEHPFVGGLNVEFKERPFVWIVTPSGQRVKYYRSYEDYCED